MKKLTVEGIRESARKIHYGAGHDAILLLLEELDNAKKVQTVTDQSWRKLMEEREKLIKGLRFYATLANYFQPKPFATPFVEVDRGQKARDILKQIGVDINV